MREYRGANAKIARSGYPEGTSTDSARASEALGLFITGMLAVSIGQGNGVTTVAMPWFVPKLPDPGEIDVAACRSTIRKGRSGTW